MEVTAVVASGCEMMTILKQLHLSMNKLPLSYGLARLLLSRWLSFQSSYQCLEKYKHCKSVSVGLKSNFSKEAIFTTFKCSRCCHFSTVSCFYERFFCIE